MKPYARRFSVWTAMTIGLAGCGDAHESKAHDATSSDIEVADDGGEGGPADLTVTTSLSETSVVAGALVLVTCDVTDATGATHWAETRVEAPAALTLSATTVLAYRAGSHTLTCRLVERDAEAEHVPATLEVQPGPAAGVHLLVTPDLPVYSPDQLIAVEARLGDTYGNEVGAGPSSITVTPSAAALDRGDGTFTLTGASAVALFSAERDGFAGSLALRVDNAPPSVTITGPAPGQMVSATGPVTVTGNAADDGAGLASVTINGAPVGLDGDGGFAFEITSVQGLNLVTVRAEDAAGNVAIQTVSWLYSPSWLALGASQGVNTTLVIDTTFGTAYLGDGSYDEPPDDLGESLVRQPTQLSGATLPDVTVPFAFAAGGGASCSPSFSAGPATLSTTLLEVVADPTGPSPEAPILAPREGGLDLEWSGAVVFTAELTASVPFVAVSAGAGFPCSVSTQSSTATFRLGTFPVVADVTIRGGVELDKPLGQPLSSSHSLVATVTGATAGHPSWSADTSLLLGTAASYDLVFGSSTTHTFSTTIGALDPGLVDSAAAVTSDVDLVAASQAAMSQALPVLFDRLVALLESPTGSFETRSDAFTVVTGTTRLHTLTLTPSGARARYDSTLDVSPAQPLAALGPGSILWAGCLEPDPGPSGLASVDGLAIGTHLDLLNRALYLAWAGASWPLVVPSDVVFDAQALLPDGVVLVRASFDAALPPVLSDCRHGDGTLELQWGDLAVTVELGTANGPTTAVIWLSAAAEPEVTAGDGVTLSLPELAWAGSRTDAPDGDPTVVAVARSLAMSLARSELIDRFVNDALAALPSPIPTVPGADGDVPLVTLSGPMIPEAGRIWVTSCDGAACEVAP